MDFRRTIRIGAHSIQVEEFKANDLKSETRMGTWNPQTNRIHLQEDLPEDRKIEVFLHEVVHGILTANADWREESVVTVLGEGIALFLRSNPGLVRDILDTYQKMEEPTNVRPSPQPTSQQPRPDESPGPEPTLWTSGYIRPWDGPDYPTDHSKRAAQGCNGG